MTEIWQALKKLVKDEEEEAFHTITQFTAALLLKFQHMIHIMYYLHNIAEYANRNYVILDTHH